MRGEFFGSEFDKIDFKLINRLITFLKPYKKWVVIAFILTLFVSALGPLRPYLTKVAIDDNLAKGDSPGLLIMVAVIFGLLVIHGSMRFGLTYLMQWVGQSVLNDIRIKLYEHIQNLSMKFHDKNPVGRMVTRVTNDVETLNQLFSSGLVMMLADIMLIFWILGFMFYTDTRLTLLTITVLPLLLITTSIFRKRVRILFRDLRAQVSKLNSFMNEFITGISTVKIFNQEAKLNEQFDFINSNIKILNIKTVFYYALFYPAVEMISAIAIAIVLWYSMGNILSGTMTIGILIAFIQYAQMFFRPIRDLSEKYTTLQNAMASSERIFDTLDTEDFLIEKENMLQFSGLTDSIEFKDLWFSYDNSKWVLKNVNFTIKKGETVAIVGATGSGKTSIINLICRFYDFQKGRILIDGIDIQSFSQKSLREKLSIVQQDVFLFSRSIEENISMGDENISFEDVQNAARKLGVSDFIDNQPDKYLTQVSERGQTLSSGQKQLIAFSRAYASNPDILILDEATSNIDTETELLIEKSLEELLKNRTSIVIAHRLSTIKRANKIILIHKGEIREIGTHEELLGQNGIYAKLYQIQYDNLN